LVGDAAYIPRSVLDGSQQIARDIPSRGADFRSTDPQCAPVETQTIESPRPAKQRGVPAAANIGNNSRSDAFRSRIVRAASREEFRGHRFG
jgi:hypothetical protein